MNRSTFVIFGLVVLILGVGIPAWAITQEGSESASPDEVASNLEGGKELFVTNCGACHTLGRGGTDGIVGPNLDDVLGQGTPETNMDRVASAIENGGTGEGRMPAGILQGEDAKLVANFVARVAGQ